MKKLIFFICLILVLSLSCNNKKGLKLVHVSQLASDPVTELSIDGFLKSLEDKGYRNKFNIRIEKQNAQRQAEYQRRQEQQLAEQKQRQEQQRLDQKLRQEQLARQQEEMQALRRLQDEKRQLRELSLKRYN